MLGEVLSSLGGFNTAVTAACLAFSVTLPVFKVADVHFPHVYQSDKVNVTNLNCSVLDFGKVEASFDTHHTAVDLYEATQLTCTANLSIRLKTGAAPLAGEVTLGVHVAPGMLRLDTMPEAPASCLVGNVTRTTCTLKPSISDASVRLPPSEAVDQGVINLVIALVKSEANKLIPELLCGKGVAALKHQLLDHTVKPREPLPTALPGSTSIRGNRLMVAAVNILNQIPVLFGLRFGAEFESTNAIMVTGRAVQSQNFTFDSRAAGFFLLPGGTQFSAELALEHPECTEDVHNADPASTGCVFSNGLYLVNVRLASTGTAEVNAFIDNVAASYAELLFDDVLNATLRKALGPSEAIRVNWDFPVAHITPRVWLMALLTITLLVADGLILYFCSLGAIRRIIGPDEPLTRGCWRKLLEDAVLVYGSTIAMLLFAWSNQVDSAELIIGGDIRFYAFSLKNSIDDMWAAGLKVLSASILLFSGMYPYLKMIGIKVFAVVLQRPESNVLMAIDVLGKFSLLDCFIMTQLANSLTIKGIAEVSIKPGFNIFIAATVLSISVGNIATRSHKRTHFGQRQLAVHEIVTPSSEEEPRKIAEAQCTPPPNAEAECEAAAPLLCKPAVNSSVVSLNLQSQHNNHSIAADYDMLVTAEQEPPRSCFSRGEAGPQPYVWYVSAPAAILVLLGSVISGHFGTINFEMSGMASLITGVEHSYSLWDLFKRSSLPLMVLCLATVYILPICFVLGFPKIRVLSAWCATDAFMLGCVAGVLRTREFIAQVLGPALGATLTVNTQLLWPIWPLLVSMLVQWVFIVRVVLRL